MEQQKVDMFMMTNAKFFPEDKTLFIRERLLAMDDSKAALLMTCNSKTPQLHLLSACSWAVTALTVSTSATPVLVY